MELDPTQTFLQDYVLSHFGLAKNAGTSISAYLIPQPNNVNPALDQTYQGYSICRRASRKIWQTA